MAASLWRKTFLHCRNSIFKLHCRTGYVILIPHSPEEESGNEVYSKSGLLVEFDKSTAKDVRNILVRKSQQHDVGVIELCDEVSKMLENKEEIDVFKHILDPMEMLYVPFFGAWGMVETLYRANNEFMPTKIYAPLYQRSIEINGERFNMKPIYDACKQCLEKDRDKYTMEERRVLEKYVLEGSRYGLDLSLDDRVKRIKIVRRKNMRVNSYYEKWLNAHLLFREAVYDQQFVKDFPPDIVRYTAMDPDKPEEGPWILTLKPRVLERIMEYCDNRQCRLEMWMKERQICSNHGDQRCRAVLEVEDLREMRKILSKMQGYPTHAHYVIESKMAGNLDTVHDLLEVLLEKAKIGQENEVDELETFAHKHNFLGQIELWDLDYWGRLHKKELYHFDEIALQEYFPLSQVMLGLFALCEQLFGIVIEEVKCTNSWHPDVREFRVLDEKTKQELGTFFLDPYARKSKNLVEHNGSMCTILSVRSKICNTLPSVALVFDFEPPLPDKPSLLLFKEVRKLFYAFGCTLQLILSETTYSQMSGHFNIEGDASKVAPMFLTHWLYERGTLESVSGHYNTGEPLPSHILDGVCNMQQHMAGTNLCKDIYMAHLDLKLHIQEEFCMEIVEELWPKHFLFEYQTVDHHPYSLKDLWVDNSSLFYYNKIWSSVMAADLFHAFKEAGFKNHEEMSLLGRRFRSTYFALAGSCPAKEVFQRFRGRELSHIPYLKTLALDELKPSIDDGNKDAPKIDSS